MIIQATILYTLWRARYCMPLLALSVHWQSY